MVEQEIIVKQIRNDDDTLNMMIMGKLVRCKDCRWQFDCTDKVRDDWYCPSGERWKDGEQHETD